MSQLSCLQGSQVVRAVSFRAGLFDEQFTVATKQHQSFNPTEMRKMVRCIDSVHDYYIVVVFTQDGLRFDASMTTTNTVLDKLIHEALAPLPFDKQRIYQILLKPSSAREVEGNILLEHVQLTVPVMGSDIVMEDLLPIRLTPSADIFFSGNGF
jgi:hypothetical protein